MQEISNNEPLLFVHGPPVFIRVNVTDEESTSVFTLTTEEELAESDKKNQKVNPSITRRIAYLEGAFQKEIYRPLQFDVGDKTLTGAMDRVDGDTIIIEIGETDKEFLAVEINTIKEIFWRGTPFIEN